MTRKRLLRCMLLGWMVESESTRTSLFSCLAVGALSESLVCTCSQPLPAMVSPFSTVIQLSKLSGFDPIITTASLYNADALKAIGATHVLDRNLPSDVLFAEIKRTVDDSIRVIYDSISQLDTQNVGYDVLAPGGALIVVRPSKIEEKKVTDDKRICEVFGDFNMPQHHRLGAGLFAQLPQWLHDGSIKVRSSESALKGY